MTKNAAPTNPASTLTISRIETARVKLRGLWFDGEHLGHALKACGFSFNGKRMTFDGESVVGTTKDQPRLAPIVVAWIEGRKVAS